MLIKRKDLDAIERGKLSCLFRRWARPRVRAGSTVRTAIGVLAIDRITALAPEELTVEDARAAGFASVEGLVESLGGDPANPLFRIDVHLAGSDPRVDLRTRTSLTEQEVNEIARRLDRMDHHSRDGHWTRSVLHLIAERAGVPASELAVELGVEKVRLKRNVRKLKELGLTESLSVGYRLSPRGEVVLATLS